MRFSNNQKDLLQNIYKLPDELIFYEIYQYIPKQITMFLSKTNYKQEHHLLKQYIRKNQIENYYRAMIRQDNDFVVVQLLDENKHKWSNMRSYYYKSCIYPNYLTFLEYYAIEHESTKCRMAINNMSKELGLKSQPKNILKYILH